MAPCAHLCAWKAGRGGETAYVPIARALLAHWGRRGGGGACGGGSGGCGGDGCGADAHANTDAPGEDSQQHQPGFACLTCAAAADSRAELDDACGDAGGWRARVGEACVVGGARPE
jgi:hypothetical protein